MLKNVFLFSGQGSHYYQMGEALYRQEERFKAWMDKLDRIVQDLLHRSIIDLLYNENRGKSDDFTRTLYTHPALFMVEYSLANTLIDSGTLPDFLLGASLGEYLALAVAGVLPVEDCLTSLIRQARNVETNCQPGAMIGVMESPQLYEREPLIYEHSALAGINTETHFVISGFQAHMQAIEAWLKQNGKLFQVLPVRYGFHSANIDPARECLLASFQSAHLNSAACEVVSCLTGKKLVHPDALDAAYFWNVARQPIRFPEALQALHQEHQCGFNIIDVGPAGTYAGFASQHKALGNNSGSRIFRVMTPFGGDLSNLEALRHKLKPIPKTNRKAIPNESVTDMKLKAFIFPGQGSQAKGMGQGLFEKYKTYTQAADEILGYSIEALCLDDPQNNLGKTQYTQPALFVVNALSYLNALETDPARPDFLAGHSLGEYNALFAAKVIDFQTGLRLVQKRGELMAGADNGGMAAIIGMHENAIRNLLEENGLKQIEIANLNSPSQIVISGERSAIEKAKPVFERNNAARYIILNVSGAFHSKLMAAAGAAFKQYLDEFKFSAPEIPVVSNVLARPYPAAEMKELLARQMTRPVKWMESIRYMWGKGVEAFVEIGPGRVLTQLVKSIQKESTPLREEGLVQPPPAASMPARAFKLSAAALGCAEFKKKFRLKYAYVTGGMAHGIASPALVAKIGRAGMIGYLGTGSLPPDAIENAIIQIQSELDQGQAYGMNLLAGPDETQQVELFLKHNVPDIEAAGYIQISPALVKYKLRGLRRKPDGAISIGNRIMAKLSRPEVAAEFLNPAPEALVADLLTQGAVSEAQAAMARNLPMADALCIAADSGGRTDMGVLSALLPTMIRLRDTFAAQYRYPEKIGVGAAGGIGTPEAAAAAFILGADFILTGSINQCTAESGASPIAKDMLQSMNVQDTAYAPAGGLFEIGAKTQVLKKGLFFPARANKLYELYRQYDSLDGIDANTRAQLEKRYFKMPVDAVYAACEGVFPAEEIKRAQISPKHRMALIFKWYFTYASQLALEGKEADKVNFQIYCGPALGAFNQWVKGTPLEHWRNRHVDEIALKLLNETSDLLTARFEKLAAAS